MRRERKIMLGTRRKNNVSLLTFSQQHIFQSLLPLFRIYIKMTRENGIVGGRITREMTRIISSIEALCLCGGGRSSVTATWIIYYYAKIVKNMLLPRPPSAQPPVTRSENKKCCDRERKCVIVRENHLKKRCEEGEDEQQVERGLGLN